MTALIELLEAATEGSRELDVEIVFALYPESIYQPQCVGDEPIFWSDPYYKQECPAFTTSLAAALTLVPEGWLVTGLTNGTLDPKYLDVRKLTHWRASLMKDRMSFSNDLLAIAVQPTGYGANPALALCIAALKARAA